MEKLSSSCEEQQHLLDKYLSTVDPELIDDALIEQLLNKICIDSEDRAILVFLPGWVKLLNPDYKIEEFLQKTLDPPVYETIRNAIIVLQDIGACHLMGNLQSLEKG
ncbi:hypothetical protein MTR67_052278 [Solanum verrucosum]|uniref:Uncharacterized protein n=1 Tax=Solanum verrucosum TaxID=315347 RepID=A0AAF1A2R6_SOLVR|nr:hypothetical protein MTR67_052278 [Solanum verrucosum]